ncbi:MAG: hypothetical protein AAF688_05520 [Bacteroidota bacterium]
MKKTIFLLTLLAAFNIQAQSLKSMTDQVSDKVESADQGSFIDKFSGDQVRKWTKKLNLSESQQSQITSLVVSQLKSDKFQKIISGFTPDKLLSGAANKEVSKALNNDKEFKASMNEVLTDEQKEKVNKLDSKM